MSVGTVRDVFFDKTPKDYDIEVYGLEPATLKSFIEQLFGKAREIGESFGILNVALDNGLTIDISLPRLDSKNSGPEPLNFGSNTDPNMSLKEGARRRDFTINALAADPLTGELFDYYDSLADIKNKILRVTDKKLFADDVLRVLRGIQFISRFGLTAEKSTAKILSQLASQVKNIPKSRITEEWKKLLIKSEQPSLGLEVALELGILKELYPMLAALKDTPQDKEWHPEGDVWTHTMMVLDEEKKITEKNKLGGDNTFVQMLAALTHDLGKVLTTETDKDGRITAHGHEPIGRKPTTEFLDLITDEIKLKEKVLKLVTNHMIPGSWYRSIQRGEFVSDNAIERLARNLYPVTIYDLVMLCEADSKGRTLPGLKERKEYAPGIWLTAKAKELGVYKEKPKPLFTGKDLLALGYEPGPLIGQLIELGQEIRSHENTLRKLQNGASSEPYAKEEALALIVQTKDPVEAITVLNNRIAEILKKI